MVFFSGDKFKTASTQEWRIPHRNRKESGIESQKTSQPLGGLNIQIRFVGILQVSHL